MSKILERATQLPLGLHAAAAAASCVWFMWIKSKLDQSYAASRHPVDYATGQTAFSGAKVKDYYAAMIETETLGIYMKTQVIDFGFLLGIALFGAFVCTLVARLARAGSWGRKTGLTAGLAFALGALSDAIENGWSFVMLADPDGFANWLALAYSGFAVLKFALITLGMALLVICVMLALAGRLLKNARVG